MFSHSWSPLMSARTPSARTPPVDIGGFLLATLFNFYPKNNLKIALADLIAPAIKELRSSSKAPLISGRRVLKGLIPWLFD